MSCIRITLFDFDQVTNEPKEPISAELPYDPDMSLEDQGFKKLAIFAGDDVGGGTIFIPLQALTILMAHVMKADEERSSKIIMPKKPGIIKPN